MQRDAKLVSYDVVEKNTKPYVQVEIGDEKKVRLPGFTITHKDYADVICCRLNFTSAQ